MQRSALNVASFGNLPSLRLASDFFHSFFPKIFPPPRCSLHSPLLPPPSLLGTGSPEAMLNVRAFMFLPLRPHLAAPPFQAVLAFFPALTSRSPVTAHNRAPAHVTHAATPPMCGRGGRGDAARHHRPPSEAGGGGRATSVAPHTWG